MPRAIQIPLVDPTDTAELPAQADPGSILLYADIVSGQVFKRDAAGMDFSLEGGQVVYAHNGVKGNVDSPYAASVNETVECNPTAGMTVSLPDPATLTGRVIRVVNVTSVQNPAAVPFDPDAITVQALIGGLSGQDPLYPQDVLRTPGESREYESNGSTWVLQ
jgi:hypothetical protein